MIGWLAGLIDGEGSFMIHVSTRKSCENGLYATLMFELSMSPGEWEPIVEKILRDNEIKFNLRVHNHIRCLRVDGNDNTQKLCKLLSPHSVIKKPIVDKFLEYTPRKQSNRFTGFYEDDINKLADFVDFVREFNKKRNVPYKWNGDTIREFYKTKKQNRKNVDFRSDRSNH